MARPPPKKVCARPQGSLTVNKDGSLHYAAVVERRLGNRTMISERRVATMVNRHMHCLLLANPTPDLPVVPGQAAQEPRWRATWRLNARSLPATEGVQLLQGEADVYAMSRSATAMQATQGGCIAGARGVHVTDTKFSTRLGPPPTSPPV
jgi:hypothetical protein